MSRWNPESAYQRVMNRTVVDGDCVIFTGHRDRWGYGVVRDGDVLRKTHRVVYEQEVGPIQEDMTIDHLCQRTSCVNTAHMEVVTPGENAARAAERRGMGRARDTTCSYCGAPVRPRSRSSVKGTARYCSRQCHTLSRVT